MSESNDKITPEFLHALYHFTRIKDQAIGIGHETAVQKAIRNGRDERLAERAARHMMAGHVHSEIKGIQETAVQLQTAVNENTIAEAERLEHDITLAAELLEVLENDE